MLNRNVWGGWPEIIPENDDSHDGDGKSAGGEWDQAAYRTPTEEVKQGWLLKPNFDHINRAKKKKHMKATAVRTAVILLGLAVAASVAAAVAVVVIKRRHPPPPQPENYTVALHKALLFFDAQKSGKLPRSNNIPWRGDSCTGDVNSGGYYDGGDASKFNFPASFAMTLLSWSVIEYGPKYEAIGELDHVKHIIKWGTDYLLTTFNSSADSIESVPSQIVSSTIPDPNACWIRPEDVTGKRKPDVHGSYPSLGAEMAAALASASIVFRDDDVYSSKLVNGAKTLFKFATKEYRVGCNGGNDPSMAFYNSTGYWDEFLWGGAWLYYASGNKSYIDFVTQKFPAKCSRGNSGGSQRAVFSWDNKRAGADLLLARLRMFLDYGYPYEEMLSKYHSSIGSIACSYLSTSTAFERTKGGLIDFDLGNGRGSAHRLQYVANAAFLATLFSDYLETLIEPGWQCGTTYVSKDEFVNFARTQVNYILGYNPRGMSYVVGFGNKYPLHVHHRGASIPNSKSKIGCKEGQKWRDSKDPNPNVIVGAMVGGPDREDGFRDVRSNYNYTEPSLAGNAGLVAALVALSGERKTGIDKNAMFYAVPPYAFFAVPPPDA